MSTTFGKQGIKTSVATQIKTIELERKIGSRINKNEEKNELWMNLMSKKKKNVNNCFIDKIF